MSLSKSLFCYKISCNLCNSTDFQPKAEEFLSRDLRNAPKVVNYLLSFLINKFCPL